MKIRKRNVKVIFMATVRAMSNDVEGKQRCASWLVPKNTKNMQGIQSVIGGGGCGKQDSRDVW